MQDFEYRYAEIARFDRPLLANGKQATRVDADPDYHQHLQELFDRYPSAIVSGSVFSVVVVEAMIKRGVAV
jgi:hypothetical protein